MTSTPVAWIFPGQGSQVVGMGKELADRYESAARVFEEANEAVGVDLRALCFNGPQDELDRTANTQPALVATSIAAMRAAEEASGGPLPEPTVVLGHSLGEFSALVAGGALALADAVRLVRTRGELMQTADPVGAMAAVIGVDAYAVARALIGTHVVVANDNAPGQVVISGPRAELARAAEDLKNIGAKRVIPLRVSAAFHSPAMQTAAPRLRLGFAFMPHGAVMAQWTPATEGAGFEFTRILKPLEPFRDRLNVVSGLGHRAADTTAVHSLSPTTWLSGVRPKPTQGVDAYAGVTVDQIAAQQIGQRRILVFPDPFNHGGQHRFQVLHAEVGVERGGEPGGLPHQVVDGKFQRRRLGVSGVPLLDVGVGSPSRNPLLGTNLLNERQHAPGLRRHVLDELLNVPLGRHASLLRRGALRQHRNQRQNSNPGLHSISLYHCMRRST